MNLVKSARQVKRLVGGAALVLATTALVVCLLIPGVALAAPSWSVQKISSDDTVDSIPHVAGDYVVWATCSPTALTYDLYCYQISTRRLTRVAGQDLPYRVGFVASGLKVHGQPVTDGTHIAWVEAGRETSAIILYDMATGEYRRLTAGLQSFGFWANSPSVQGDWLVWVGHVDTPGAYWPSAQAVFAYRISTQGPIQTIRWSTLETQPHAVSYVSQDDDPVVSGGKMAWSFKRPDGHAVGIMDLASAKMEWTWNLPAGVEATPQAGYPGQLNTFSDGYLLISGKEIGTKRYALWLRNPGAAEPTVLVPLSDAVRGGSTRSGLTSWAVDKDAFLQKQGGEVKRLTLATPQQQLTSAMHTSTDGSSIVWYSLQDRKVWWYDSVSGQSSSISGSNGGQRPFVSGKYVVWSGDETGITHGVYLATRGDGGQGFPDVSSRHPYYTAIAGMAARQIIGGYVNGNFGPEDLVMRQQFAKMIVGTLGLDVVEEDWQDANKPFRDFEPDDLTKLYPHEYVAVCARNNITKGTTDPTKFAPLDNIKRQQMITMVVRAADNLAPGALAAVPDGWSGQLSYADPTHGANIKKAEYSKLLTGIIGSGGTLASWNTGGNATRGEVAQVLWNLLGKLD